MFRPVSTAQVSDCTAGEKPSDKGEPHRGGKRLSNEPPFVTLAVVREVPGTLQEGGASFEATRWSVVLLTLQDESPEIAHAALATFCHAYWPPLYTFLRRRGYSPSDAQDLTQEFFAHLLEQNTLVRADRDKGRLRTFLLGALQHFLEDAADRLKALKRGGGKQIISLQEHLVEAEAITQAVRDEDAATSYDQSWAAALARRAREELKTAFAHENKLSLFDALEPFVFGGSKPLPDQEEVAARLAMPLATLRTSLHRLRQRYRESLRTEVANTISDPADVDDELRYLYRLLMA
ncbi:MAG: sigma-70 family RNA polymerase sigma factor [Rhodospirillales bacterium]|nr:sigma-70 family RNA polymerase sigma factor [Acetobacter sp.]